MSSQTLSRTTTTALFLAGSLALACGQSARSTPPADATRAQPVAETAARSTVSTPSPAVHASTSSVSSPVLARDSSPAPVELKFTGTKDETAQFIRYYKTIQLTPEQELVKVEALSTIAAPCCANNPLSTCCCPCNMAKAAWGMSAWLITEKGYGVAEIRQAAKDWLAVANPDGFSGDACYTGGCGRAIHQNGCGGMDDRTVL